MTFQYEEHNIIEISCARGRGRCSPRPGAVCVGVTIVIIVVSCAARRGGWYGCTLSLAAGSGRGNR